MRLLPSAALGPVPGQPEWTGGSWWRRTGSRPLEMRKEQRLWSYVELGSNLDAAADSPTLRPWTSHWCSCHPGVTLPLPRAVATTRGQHAPPASGDLSPFTEAKVLRWVDPTRGRDQPSPTSLGAAPCPHPQPGGDKDSLPQEPKAMLSPKVWGAT